MYTEFFSPDLDPFFKTVFLQPPADTLRCHLDDLTLSAIIALAAQIERTVRPVKEQVHPLLICVCHQCSVHRATSLC